ncbi:MAG: hypothetical protein E7474_02425 [Ruminococcaceae bacterium]|nr:hypothetical protein [Oscillospiraceae bacterium]
MKKKTGSLFGFLFAALVLLVVFFMIRRTFQRPPEVVLPEITGTEEVSGVIPETAQDAVRRVEVTPDTVQRVIDRLARPESYSRTMVIERFWPGGSGQSTASVTVSGGWTRVDLTRGEAETRHLITGGGQSWIWYGEEDRVYSGAAALTADEEEGIPTYEDILRLPVDEIVAADYRALEGVNCIYVETSPDSFGYSQRYWVRVDNGLLVYAERMDGEEVVYRMSGLETDPDVAPAQAFALPDGTPLYGGEDANEENNTEG